MRIEVHEALKELAKVFPGGLFVVGGYVRNALAGYNSSDIDICGPLRLEEISLPEGFHVVTKYARMGTGLIKCSRYPGIDMEYTAFRSEKYASGGAHSPSSVTFGASIEEDARRRDFTVNSIYYDVKNDELIDPLGGIKDVENGVLRAFNPRSVFSSDGLRLMRLVRISAETGFAIEEKTSAAAKRYAGLLKDVTPNRKYDELKKILCADGKYGVNDAHYRGLCLLREYGMLEYVVPELNNLDGLAQPAFHKFDALEHSFLTARYASQRVRLAALLHDVGKARSLKETGNFHKHCEMGAVIVDELLGKNYFNLPLKEKHKTVRLIKNHMYDADGSTKSGKLRLFIAANSDIIEELQELMEADARAHGNENVKTPRLLAVYTAMRKEKTPMNLKELSVSGSELEKEGFKGGEIKKTLDYLLRESVLNPSVNKKGKLMEMARRFKVGAEKK